MKNPQSLARLRPFAQIAVLVALLSIGFGPVAAQEIAPVGTSANPFAGLGLPEIAVTITNDTFEGVPAELTAGRYILAVTNEFAETEEETSGVAFLRLPADVRVAEFVLDVSTDEGGSWPRDWYYDTALAGGPYAFSAKPPTPSSICLKATGSSGVRLRARRKRRST